MSKKRSATDRLILEVMCRAAEDNGSRLTFGQVADHVCGNPTHVYDRVRMLVQEGVLAEYIHSYGPTEYLLASPTLNPCVVRASSLETSLTDPSEAL